MQLTGSNKKIQKNWLISHKKPILISIFSVIFIAAATVIICLVIIPRTNLVTLNHNSDQDAPKPLEFYYSNLTGLEVDSKSKVNQAATCIMVENSPEARPQSGLKQAGIIYEAIAEGGITRFLTIFQEAKPTLIGPVRSVRLYYADWLTPYHCSIAHVGGATDALNLIRGGNYRDIDQFFNSATYWRSKDRYAPHNVYTNFEKLDALNASKGYTSSDFTGFDRYDPDHETEIPEAPITSIDISMSSKLFNVSYIYDKTTNTYLRSHQSGGAHMDKSLDGTLSQNSPSVVIAMMVSQSLSSDRVHNNIVTTGSGKAYIFQNQTLIEGNWQKPTRDSELKFIDQAGNSIPLNRGQVWITAVPSQNSVNWK